jgi:hypothetical protein
VLCADELLGREAVDGVVLCADELLGREAVDGVVLWVAELAEVGNLIVLELTTTAVLAVEPVVPNMDVVVL